MSPRFVINGIDSCREKAIRFVSNKAIRKGRDEQEIRATFSVACTPEGEEQRDIIFDVSDHMLEITVHE